MAYDPPILSLHSTMIPSSNDMSLNGPKVKISSHEMTPHSPLDIGSIPLSQVGIVN